MVKRDPQKTALNQRINTLTSQLETLYDQTRRAFGVESVQSLHGTIGGKNAKFIDVRQRVILSPDQYYAEWLHGLLIKAEEAKSTGWDKAYVDLVRVLQGSSVAKEYVKLFQHRTYLRNQHALSRRRPTAEDAEIWIGQNRAEFGLLVTPRFVRGMWENDGSEIRHFSREYWTIGHVLETGFVVPGDPDRLTFSDVDQYLVFFKNSLVRASGSRHEKALASRYVDFVRNHPEPESVPLMIPELRWAGIEPKHEYRLDFTIINPFTLQKVGLELSPWSTHGQLTKTKQKTQAKINDEARGNFEKEARKCREYFDRHGITVLIYPDDQLQDHDALFEKVKPYLSPQREVRQLELHALDALDRFQL